jgi:hypothetical protein
MTKQYQDYFWKEGIPYGIHPTTLEDSESYTIAMDPYRKRISVEKYLQGEFNRVIYDSAFINFRKLQPMHQTAWQKSTIKKEKNREVCLIRDQDNRIVLIETYHFKDNFCLECQIESPHGFFLATQKMFFEELNDHFNGVILFDANHHPVMGKSYEIDKKTGLFTNVLTEEWNFGQNTFFDKAIQVHCT